jgi:c-di-AMP phosphodiesterase-like protein
MVDNYEEIMQRLSAEEKPHIIAKIEKAIYDWAEENSGLVIKTDRNTYIYVFEQKYLSKMEENKFNILDTIKDSETESEIPLTLSIAISNDGESNYEKYKSALASIDIALGRGGDQAVVRKEGKYIFYGGRTQEVEKRTKVKARIIATALEKLMIGAKNVIIMGHINPDMDCMGASLGLYRLAKVLGKQVYIVNNSLGANLENFVETLQKEEEYMNIIIDKNQALTKITPETLLIIVDTHKSTFVEVPELLEETEKIVLIDHHRRSTDFIENSILTFHEVYASSASELVAEILQYAENEIELTRIETESLYAGIMIDTKNFTFKTGVRTFEAAAYLRKFGVDIIKVKKWFQSDLDSYKTIADVVNKVSIVHDTIGISEYDGTEEDSSLVCAKAADELLTINNITASFVIGNIKDKVCISGRSIGDINVQIILEKLRWRRTYNTCWSAIRRNNNGTGKRITNTKN